MAMLSVDHPDILNFISAKQNPGDFANFNISIKIPDAFMAALQSKPDTPHVVTNPRTGQRYLLPRSLGREAGELPELARQRLGHRASPSDAERILHNHCAHRYREPRRNGLGRLSERY